MTEHQPYHRLRAPFEDMPLFTNTAYRLRLFQNGASRKLFIGYHDPRLDDVGRTFSGHELIESKIVSALILGQSFYQTVAAHAHERVTSGEIACDLADFDHGIYVVIARDGREKSQLMELGARFIHPRSSAFTSVERPGKEQPINLERLLYPKGKPNVLVH